MSAKDFQKLCRSVDKAFSQFAKVVEKGVGEAAEAFGQSSEQNLEAHRKLQEKRERKAAKRAAKQAARAQAQAQAAQAQAQARAQARAQAQTQAQAQARAGAAPSGAPGWAPGQPPVADGGYGAPMTAGGAGVPGSAPAYAPHPFAPVRGGTPVAPKKRFRPTWGLTASGVLMAAVGGSGALFSGVCLAAGVAAGMMAIPGGVVATTLFGAITVGFGVLFAFGIRRLRRSSNLKAVRRIVGEREVCDIGELASRMQVSPKKALSVSRALVRSGDLPQGRLDDEGRALILTDEAHRAYLRFQQSQRQALAAQQAAAQQAAKDAKDAKDAKAAPGAGGRASGEAPDDALTPEQRAFVDRGRDFLRRMAELNARIDDTAVSERVTSLEDITARILARAEDEPAVIAGLDKLNAYFLPATVKLLGAYDDLEEQPVQGENISSSRREIERTLAVLNSAFEKLLDDTYQDLSMDVSSDISVLHALLAQEGLTDGPFDAKAPH